MTKKTILKDKRHIRAVERGVAELRRGRPVVILTGDKNGVLAAAPESMTETALRDYLALSGGPLAIGLTRQRAKALGLPTNKYDEVYRAALKRRDDLQNILSALFSPTDQLNAEDAGLLESQPAQDDAAVHAAVRLGKLARLVPAMLLCPLKPEKGEGVTNWSERQDLVAIPAEAALNYDVEVSERLNIVSRARVPLADAAETEIIAFRPDDGGAEHLAIIIGQPRPGEPVLVRMHSECFTGDILGSLRCDCGEQLREAVKTLSEAGGGVLLYLAQEGRGIGLVNKLRAYALQDGGMDTIEANEHLGFGADERMYVPAARMLKALGFSKIRLMTNNPYKMRGLNAIEGIEVIQRVPHVMEANVHNEAYLKTKAKRGGHLY